MSYYWHKEFYEKAMRQISITAGKQYAFFLDERGEEPDIGWLEWFGREYPEQYGKYEQAVQRTDALWGNMEPPAMEEFKKAVKIEVDATKWAVEKYLEFAEKTGRGRSSKGYAGGSPMTHPKYKDKFGIAFLRGRGFEVVSSYKDKGIELPKRATAQSAGYDIAAAEDFMIPARKVGLVPTGLKVYMHFNEYLSILLRSSIAIKNQLMIAQNVAIIDADYYDNPENEGHIFIPVLNYSDSGFSITKGDRIAQGIFMQYLYTDDDIGTATLRTGGLGSTGIIPDDQGENI